MNAMGNDSVTDTLLTLLDGCRYASADMDHGKPGPIRLSDAPDDRRRLVEAHLAGRPGRLTVAKIGEPERDDMVRAVSLAQLTPTANGFCNAIGIDLDAGDHGAKGLADPVRAMLALAVAADRIGLADGLLTNTSRGGKGRHLRIMPDVPAALEDAVLVSGWLCAVALAAAERDAEDGTEHAFQRLDGTIAQPGDAGAWELYPRSTERPERGWSLALPAAGKYAERGGLVIVDPFEDQPVTLGTVPRTKPGAWARVVRDARRALARRTRPKPSPPRPRRFVSPAARPSPRTEALLSGRVAPGARNAELFAATLNLIGCGLDAREAERLALEGAIASGLPEREARSTIHSALRRKGVV